LPIQFDEPILSLDTWHRLRGVLQPRPRSERRVPRPSRILSGLVSCAHCGGRMNPGPTGGDGRHSYRCSTASRGGECVGVSIRCEPLEAYVVNEFLRIFGELPVLRHVEIAADEPAALVEVRAAIESAGEAMKEPDANYAALGERLRRLHAERERLEAAPRNPRVEVTEDGRLSDVWHRNEHTERRRDLLADALRAIEVGPGKAGRRPFNPERVQVTWAQGSLLSDYGKGESAGPMGGDTAAA
jgi:site-specific DNA recombinase